jgi:thioesterase domain-containing protein
MGSQIIFQWGPYAKDFIYIILPSKMRRKRQQDDSPSLWEYIRWAWADGIRHVFLKRADIADVVSRDKRVLLVRQPSTRRVMRVLSANIKALMKYEFKPYSGTVTLLRVEDQALMHKLHDDPLLGWGELAPDRVEVIPVPGNHAVMLAKPYLDSVGVAIHDALVRVQARYDVRAE